MDLKETKYEVKDKIALVTLFRPEQMNAFTVRMMNELLEILRTVQSDDGVRALVITGAGKAFCAGADLSAGGGTGFEGPPCRAA